MKIYIINLDSATERKQFQKNQFKKLGLDYEFFNAVGIDDIDEKSYQKHVNDWKRPLNITEIACYYSHRYLWQQIIQSNKPTLILEDDVILSNKIADLLKILTMSNDINKDVDLLNLEVHNKPKRVSKYKKRVNYYFHMLRLYQGRVGAASYILCPSGAKKLLACEKNGIAPTDVYITDCYDLINYQIEPAVAIQIENCLQYHLVCPINTTSSIKKTPSNLSLKKVKYQSKRIMHQIRLLHHPRRKIILNFDI